MVETRYSRLFLCWSAGDGRKESLRRAQEREKEGEKTARLREEGESFAKTDAIDVRLVIFRCAFGV